MPMYELVNWSGEDVKGTFYQPELQSVTVGDNKEYYVEKIISKRTRNKSKEVLVRWLHWPKKYDSWIPEDDRQHFS